MRQLTIVKEVCDNRLKSNKGDERATFWEWIGSMLFQCFQNNQSQQVPGEEVANSGPCSILKTAVALIDLDCGDSDLTRKNKTESASVWTKSASHRLLDQLPGLADNRYTQFPKPSCTCFSNTAILDGQGESRFLKEVILALDCVSKELKST